MAALSVSVVVPTYNRAHLLERALRSVIPQCGPRDEVIVADDGSTDDTATVVEAFGGPVRLLRLPHRGAGAARNAGIEAARGDLVAFLDSDDEWLPGKLSLQRAVLAAFPDLLFVFSDFQAQRPDGTIVHHAMANWYPPLPKWEEVLPREVHSAEIPGLPVDTPPFRLHVGPFFEAFLDHWCVSNVAMTVRREEAGDALHFAEDVPTLEDVECVGRLAERGLAGFMECETIRQHIHKEWRLTDVDHVGVAHAALVILSRVWGSNPAFLAAHGAEYRRVHDSHRERLVRELLTLGRREEARTEMAALSAPRLSTRLASLVPGRATRVLFQGRRRLHTALVRLKGGST